MLIDLNYNLLYTYDLIMRAPISIMCTDWSRIYDDINEQKVNFLVIDAYDFKYCVYHNIDLKDFTNKELHKLLKKH